MLPIIHPMITILQVSYTLQVREQEKQQAQRTRRDYKKRIDNEVDQLAKQLEVRQ